MELILTQDVQGVGYKNDLITVKDGYGRNFLIPKGYATVATDSKKKALAEMKKQQAYKEEKIVKEAESLAELLKDTELTIGVKAGTSGKIFGSVNSIMVANAIKEAKDLDIDRKKINIDEDHIKEVGKYTAKVKLYKDVSVDISLDVIGE
ncbi:MAG: 50S ribosomal protein L9 [Lentimicrobiaceae bacterium]|jgi:large subunit ribosomal protein L9|nr:50S ribosomal protein L9 [Lentimicrobiaceae bacterium]MCP4911253.1 50S ribosomal protein L9 [Bacteroidota bacterium]MBT3453963.1 50S ribosomal protein L9 [Lentimicrobiaceae bacterium]MBT3818574.1 50S ribosomal protein L9 [Lentimicrobiaceae bacterium]MBT4061930.1 50S ribosomal protein L9 [Lentimicrobiaceae bacterium]